MAEKEKKVKCLQPCLERMRTFTSMVYSADGINGTEAVSVKQHLALLLRNKVNQEYSEMCGFVRARMSLAVMISNTLLLRGTRDKEVYIH